MKIKIPNKKYLKRAFEILNNGDINLKKNNYSYYSLNETLFTSEQIQSLMEKKGIKNRLKLSSGTSDKMAFQGFINQAKEDLEKGTYYRFYSPPKGNINARKALAYAESIKMKNVTYSSEDICMAEGVTGAISMVFEYIKNNYPLSSALVIGPTYYLYTYLANYYKIPVKEIINTKGEIPFKFDINLLKKNISKSTKLIVLVRPNNPVGEIYSEKDLKEIFKIAKEKNILILIDEIFYDLIFNKDNIFESDVIAEKYNALSNLIIVKGYSKNKNLAAFRIGYILSKNNLVINTVATISEQRQCFANAQNYTGVICLDASLSSIKKLIYKKYSLNEAVKKVKNDLNYALAINEKNESELKKLFSNYVKYEKNLKGYYEKTYDEALSILKNDIEIILDKTVAFNTFIKIKDLENINYFDFCLNLFLTTGVESQIGPCFGLTQREWQENKNLGFWLRLSFSRETFLEGVKTFVEFKKLYLKNKSKFLKTGFNL
ncbi:MAG TPA: pyridoxal phosphate-dependent aminotransferase [Patescibacteria group bacterium]